MAEPTRSCVGCRQRRPRGMLLRWVADSRGVLCCDVLGQSVGRGAFSCARWSCLDAGCKRGGFARSLRRRLQPALADELVLRALDELRVQQETLVAAASGDGRIPPDGVTEPRCAARLERFRRLQEDLCEERVARS